MKQVFKIIVLPLIFWFLLSSCLGEKGPSLQTLLQNYKAAQDIKSEKYEEALAKYYSILEGDLERPAIHSNIGVLLNMMQKPEDALKSLLYALQIAESSGDQSLIFKIRYNLGVYYGAIKKVPDALDNYQAGLEIVPTSQEIKTNIELLLQQQKQDQKQQGEQGEQKEKNQSEGEDNKKNDQNNDKNNDQENKSQDNKDDDKKSEQKKQNSAKYQPRPFKGDQLSEGDVKKILGELKNQEQKIRANFEKNDKKGKSKNNEKDW